MRCMAHELSDGESQAWAGAGRRPHQWRVVDPYSEGQLRQLLATSVDGRIHDGVAVAQYGDFPCRCRFGHRQGSQPGAAGRGRRPPAAPTARISGHLTA
jgi:hypothetical protein